MVGSSPDVSHAIEGMPKNRVPLGEEETQASAIPTLPTRYLTFAVLVSFCEGG